MIYIIIPVHNRKKMTRCTLIYLRKQTYGDFKTLIIDDGSTDGTAEMIMDQFPEVLLLRGNGNLWWTKAVNLGISHVLPLSSYDDYILTLNDDVTFNSNYLSNIKECANNYRNSLVGSLLIDSNSKNIFFPSIKNKGLISSNNDSTIKVERLVGRGMLIPVYVFDKIGLFDKNLPHYGSDEDFSIRAKKSGFNLVVCRKSEIYINEHKKEKVALITNPIEYVKWMFSIKNPVNIYNRYIINRKHSRLWIIDFVRDLLMIFFRYIRNLFNAVLTYRGIKKRK